MMSGKRRKNLYNTGAVQGKAPSNPPQYDQSCHTEYTNGGDIEEGPWQDAKKWRPGARAEAEVEQGAHGGGRDRKWDHWKGEEMHCGAENEWRGEIQS